MARSRRFPGRVRRPPSVVMVCAHCGKELRDLPPPGSGDASRAPAEPEAAASPSAARVAPEGRSRPRRAKAYGRKPGAGGPALPWTDEDFARLHHAAFADPEAAEPRTAAATLVHGLDLGTAADARRAWQEFAARRRGAARRLTTERLAVLAPALALLAMLVAVLDTPPASIPPAFEPERAVSAAPVPEVGEQDSRPMVESPAGKGLEGDARDGEPADEPVDTSTYRRAAGLDGPAEAAEAPAACDGVDCADAMPPLPPPAPPFTARDELIAGPPPIEPQRASIAAVDAAPSAAGELAAAPSPSPNARAVAVDVLPASASEGLAAR